MPQYGHWISTKASTFYDDNPKLALLSVFSQQDDFLQDNKMVIRKLKNLCFSWLTNWGTLRKAQNTSLMCQVETMRISNQAILIRLQVLQVMIPWGRIIWEISQFLVFKWTWTRPWRMLYKSQQTSSKLSVTSSIWTRNGRQVCSRFWRDTKVSYNNGLGTMSWSSWNKTCCHSMERLIQSFSSNLKSPKMRHTDNKLEPSEN